MAHEWYIQHNDKQYGPLSSANLKKLAVERRITPATNVRLGPDGKWVPASRVQGLFAAEPTGSQSPPTAPPPPSVVVPPPEAPPPAPPPMASPLTRVPFGSVAPVGKAATPDHAIAAKITGAVGLIFGILALATCWLPMLDGLMGWTGIVVGGLGLLLGIAGLVLSAVQKGSGLYLNVAGTSSAAVGLVLTVVLGVTFGMFAGTPAPQKFVAQKPALPRVEEPPPEPAETPPEPEPPPEPVWTDASQAIEQGPVKATIENVTVENIRLESSDLSTITRGKRVPMLKIRVTIENISPDRIVAVPGWNGAGGLLGGGVDAATSALLEGSGLLKGEAAKTIQSATATARLNDNVGNTYPQTPAVQIFGAEITAGEDNALRPGGASHKDLVFQEPLDSIEYLRLELSPEGFSGSEPLRFQIPKAMITKR